MVSYIPEKHSGTRAHYAKLANQVQQLLSGYNENELEFLINHTSALTGIFQKQALRVGEIHNGDS